MGINEDELKIAADFDVLDQAMIAVRSGGSLTVKRNEEKKARPQLNQLKLACNKFRDAAKALKDITLKTVMEKKCTAFDERLKKIDSELRDLVAVPKKEEEGASHGSAAAAAASAAKTSEEKKMEEIMGEGGKQGLGFQNAKRVIGAANRAQDDINKTLQRALRSGVTTRDQTQEIIGELAKQSEKIGGKR